jgi:hypothetical protein
MHCHPSIAGKPAMMMVAGFLFLSVFVQLLKSRFFGFYVNSITLADGMGCGGGLLPPQTMI